MPRTALFGTWYRHCTARNHCWEHARASTPGMVAYQNGRIPPFPRSPFNVTTFYRHAYLAYSSTQNHAPPHIHACPLPLPHHCCMSPAACYNKLPHSIACPTIPATHMKVVHTTHRLFYYSTTCCPTPCPCYCLLRTIPPQ